MAKALRDEANPSTLEGATRLVLRGLSRRWAHLDEEATALEVQLAALVEAAAPSLLALRGVGSDVAGALLVAAGDNPECPWPP